MDTGIFLLSIIFIRYWVCCQNTRVIHILRVYIAALAPEVPNASCVCYTVWPCSSGPLHCCAATLCCSLCHPIADFVHGVFILKAHQRRSLVRMIKSLLPSWGSSSWSVFNRGKKKKKAFFVCLFPTVTWWLLFRLILLHRMTIMHSRAVVTTHNQYHVGRLGFFSIWKVCTTLPWREKLCALLLSSQEKSSVIILLPKVNVFSEQICHQHCPLSVRG